MKRLTALLLAALMVFALSACSVFGGDDDDSSSSKKTKVEGTYVVKTIDGDTPLEYFKKQADDYGMDLEDMLEWMDMDEDELDEFMVLKLKKDGTAIMTSLGEEVEGTWEKDGNTVTFEFDEDDPVEFTYKNGKLIYEVEEDGEEHELVLVKKD